MASFKFPSVLFLYQQSVVTLKRFPLAIVSAIIASTALTSFVELDGKEEYQWLLHTFLCGYLGVPLFISATIFFQDKSVSFVKNIIIHLGIILLLIAVYFSFPGDGDEATPYIRFTLYTIAAHLLVAFVGFDFSKEVNGFWQFNKALFLRFLLSALYSIVLYLGIVLALVLVTNLFNVDIDDSIYLDLFILISGIFNTWFFLSGIPKDLPTLHNESDYPKGLRTFILYVLLPLTGIYFAILYSYSIKVIGLWDWPKGIISYMIFAVAVIGILSALLAYPFYTFQESKTPLKVYQKVYFKILLPMVLMLFAAIYIRIDSYGVTINRYIILLLDIWIGGIATYLSFFGRNIKIIPVSLFLLTVLSSLGPWGMFSISENSQLSRLKAILEQSKILVDDSIVNEQDWENTETLAHITNERAGVNDPLLSDSLFWEVQSILGYLDTYHRIDQINSWFKQSISEISKEEGVGPYEYLELMGLSTYRADNNTEYHSFNVAYNEVKAYPIVGFDYLIEIDNERRFNGQKDPYQVEELGIELFFEQEEIIIQRGSDTLAIDLHKKYYELIERYPLSENSRYNLTLEAMAIEYDSDWIKGVLLLESISGDEDIDYYDGTLLLDLKE